MPAVQRLLSNSAAACFLLAFLAGCATQSFVNPEVDSASFLARRITQTDGPVTVTVAVPDAAETQSLFGLPLYEQNVQPVWLKIENQGTEPVRLAIWSIDPDYFSPLEVAWMNRGGYNKDGKAAMEQWFHENGISRRVGPDKTQSGFVFTNLKPGTKGFNVDVFSSDTAFSFTFFVPLPGFTPDYMQVDVQDLYADSEMTNLSSVDDIRQAVGSLPSYTTDSSSSKQGGPFNVVLVGTGMAVRRAMLRAGWLETEADSAETSAARRQHYRGRPPDGIFRKARADGSERRELRLWLTPMTAGDDKLWVGQVAGDLSDTTNDLTDYLLDPDIDNTRGYLFQNFWYSQSLTQVAFAKGAEATTADNQHESFSGASYFTDGMRAVLWISEDPVGLDDAILLPWEIPVRE
jgi:hypothetical protein